MFLFKRKEPKETVNYEPEIIRGNDYGIRMNVPGTWEYEDIFVQEQRNTQQFYEAYKSRLETDPDYKSQIEGVRHFKYHPIELPCRIEERNVYSYINKGEWIKIGTLDPHKIDVIDKQKRRLKLYPNIYRLIRDGETEEKEDHKYFAFPYSL